MAFLFKLRLGQKMGLGFGFITLLLICVSAFSFYSTKNSEAVYSRSVIISEEVDTAGRIQANFYHCRIAFKTMLFEKNLSMESVYIERYKNVLTYIADLKKIDADPGHLISVGVIESMILQYNDEFVKVASRKNDIMSGNHTPEIVTSLAKMDELGDRTSEYIERFKLTLLKIDDENIAQYKSIINNNMSLVLILALVGFLMSIIISIFFTKSILRPVLTLSTTFKSISEGDTNMSTRLKVSTEDEIGKMSEYFNQFMYKLESVYNDVSKQNLLKTRQTDIDDITRGDHSVCEIAKKIIDYLCKSTDATLGTLYVKSNNDQLSLAGGYAQGGQVQALSHTFHITDGIIGQAVREGKTKIIKKVPEHYFKIQSSLGESLPNNLVVVPCFAGKELICVMEFGAFVPFPTEVLEMISSISEVIAIGIGTAVSREKINELYQKTLQQTEELQVQQEELMQSHEELTEQTNALIEKENQLQIQQEELRVTNSELEEKNNDLEHQKDEISLKNNELERARDELIEKAKALEISGKYKSEFLANVSHELKTPLNSILVLSELMMGKTDNAPLTEKEIAYAKTIHSSGSELLVIITDILDLAKVEAGKLEIRKENIPFSELTHYFIQNFSEIANNKKLDFHVLCNANAEAIYTDELRLKQILKNLLSNAFKFTENGKVELIIDHLPDEGDGQFVFTVKDTGIGIEKDKQALIFEAFKQANGTINRKYGGTGLGLSISKELAKLLGGDLSVASEMDQGSTFTLVLPGADRVVANIAAVPERSPIIHEEIPAEMNTNKTIATVNSVLIIEDDEIFGNVLCEYALGKGLSPIVSSDGKSGLRLAKERLPDVIILDIGLPDMSGMDVLKALEENRKTRNIPVYIISGRDNVENMNARSVLNFLKKPVSTKQLQKIFTELESLHIQAIRNILIVGLSDAEIEDAIGAKEGVTFAKATSAQEANLLLGKGKYDCIILDKELKDMTGAAFLADLSGRDKLDMPIIVYTDKEISMKEEEELSKYSDSIIVRGARSMDRLISEIDVFLYNINETKHKRKKHAITKQYMEEDKLTGKTVLIVDDDVRNIFSLTGVLESRGMHVLVARNGNEGIDQYNEHNEIDLILMDIMMPIIDGYETINAIRKTERGKDVPIIAITAKSMPDDRNKCIEAGADDYTTKPIDVEKLISLLRVWLYK